METNPQRAVVLRFNECINNRDIEGLAELMTDGHAFIDSANNTFQGKEKALEAWRGFFDSFSDYQNVIEHVAIFSDDRVTLIGHSRCSDQRLEGPAIWFAKVDGGKIAEWRVYEDTAQNRVQMGL
jgi:ketosteroid isomerase-like protein